MRIFAALAFALLLSGCHPAEGERCNPLSFTDECASGLGCAVPRNCAVAYCCPATGKSNDANCQPCTPRDGGASD